MFDFVRLEVLCVEKGASVMFETRGSGLLTSLVPLGHDPQKWFGAPLRGTPAEGEDSASANEGTTTVGGNWL